MNCPNCQYDVSLPMGRREEDGSTMRRYRCPKCGFLFDTLEVLRSLVEVQQFQMTLRDIINREGEYEVERTAG